MTSSPKSIDLVDEHLTDEFFQRALSEGLNLPDVRIVEALVPKNRDVGENFFSDIYRATVRYRNDGQTSEVQSIALIVKAMPFTEVRGPLLDQLHVFDKEVHMYKQTLPRMSTLLGGERLSARCLYAVKQPLQVIVFEDLTADGFRMADRTSGLDVDHCRLVLEKLGRFHAASMLLADEDERSMDLYTFGLLKPDVEPDAIMYATMVGGLKAVIEAAREWPGFGDVVPKLERIAVDFFRKVDVVCNRSVPEYRVLAHGDLWVNNFMYKYDADRRPIDVCFIDYQLSFYSSPGHDLVYFLNTSPQNAVREKQRDKIVALYYNEFVATLRRLKSTHAERMSADRLNREMRARELYGLMTAVGILPLVMLDKDGDRDLSIEAMSDAEGKAKIARAMYTNPSYVEAMRHIVRRFDDEGLLDQVHSTE